MPIEKIFDFILIALAADAIATAWFFGSIFNKPFVYFKSLEEKGNLLGELMTCVVCLPFHLCFWLTLLYFCLPEPAFSVYKFILYSFAATDIVHTLQGARPTPTVITYDPK